MNSANTLSPKSPIILKPARSRSEVAISLALQGGGAWGAFTWGVLDYILADESIAIDQISGTSAGAINGAIVCSALALGQRSAARTALESFWRSVSDNPTRSVLQTLMGPVGQLVSRGVSNWMWNAGYLSPYQTDPFDLNPLRTVIAKHVDIESIRSRAGPQLFVTATNVHTGLPRVFGGAEISLDALVASACLPQVFRAVPIDGEAYWDGGYCGNPTLWPLIRHGRADDIVLVQLAPDRRPQVPRDSAGIRDRAAEIVFNSSLVAEMQAIQVLSEFARGSDPNSPFARARFHRIGPPSDEFLGEPGAAAGRSWVWLTALRDEGRSAARRFMNGNRKRLGVESTLDIAHVFFDQRKPKVNVQVEQLPDAQGAPNR
jgi:NTE family protein